MAMARLCCASAAAIAELVRVTRMETTVVSEAETAVGCGNLRHIFVAASQSRILQPIMSYYRPTMSFAQASRDCALITLLPPEFTLFYIY